MASEPTAAAPSRFYVPALDGLRFIAFGLVFVGHVVPRFEGRTFSRLAEAAPEAARWLAALKPAGLLGVELFFALSSFLITELLLREIERTGRVDVAAFFVRRALRIWPLYFVFLGTSALVLMPLGLTPALPLGTLVPFALFVGNWYCVVNGPPPNDTIVPLWSVSVEEQFYLAWPFVVRLSRKRVFPLVVVAMLAVGAVSRVGLVLAGAPGTALWCSTFSHLDAIALGAAAAFAVRRGLFHRVHPAVAPASLATLWALGRLLPTYGTQTLAHALVGYPLAALASTALCVAACSHGSWLSRRLEAPALVSLGRISYGLYMFHELALHLAAQATAGIGLHHALAAHLVKVVGGALLTVALAAVSYRLLEAPFLRLKERFARVPSRAP